MLRGMWTLLLTASLSVIPQGPETSSASKPQSAPELRPMTDRERMVEADWREDAPGVQVVRRGDKTFKWLPMVGGTYGTLAEVKDTVAETDLVIGLKVGKQAFAYPIKMLGGPQREIVNEVADGVAFAVNW